MDPFAAPDAPTMRPTGAAAHARHAAVARRRDLPTRPAAALRRKLPRTEARAEPAHVRDVLKWWSRSAFLMLGLLLGSLLSDLWSSPPAAPGAAASTVAEAGP